LLTAILSPFAPFWQPVTDLTKSQKAPFPVFLWDVCNAFDLSEQECDEVLGRSASFVRAWFGGEPEPLPK
jgi:hypothetical protein